MTHSGRSLSMSGNASTAAPVLTRVQPFPCDTPSPFVGPNDTEDAFGIRTGLVDKRVEIPVVSVPPQFVLVVGNVFARSIVYHVESVQKLSRKALPFDRLLIITRSHVLVFSKSPGLLKRAIPISDIVSVIVDRNGVIALYCTNDTPLILSVSRWDIIVTILARVREFNGLAAPHRAVLLTAWHSVLSPVEDPYDPTELPPADSKNITPLALPPSAVLPSHCKALADVIAAREVVASPDSAASSVAVPVVNDAMKRMSMGDPSLQKFNDTGEAPSLALFRVVSWGPATVAGLLQCCGSHSKPPPTACVPLYPFEELTAWDMVSTTLRNLEEILLSRVGQEGEGASQRSPSPLMAPLAFDRSACNASLSNSAAPLVVDDGAAGLPLPPSLTSSTAPPVVDDEAAGLPLPPSLTSSTAPPVVDDEAAGLPLPPVVLDMETDFCLSIVVPGVIPDDELASISGEPTVPLRPVPDSVLRTLGSRSSLDASTGLALSDPTRQLRSELPLPPPSSHCVKYMMSAAALPRFTPTLFSDESTLIKEINLVTSAIESRIARGEASITHPLATALNRLLLLVDPALPSSTASSLSQASDTKAEPSYCVIHAVSQSRRCAECSECPLCPPCDKCVSVKSAMQTRGFPSVSLPSRRVRHATDVQDEAHHRGTRK